MKAKQIVFLLTAMVICSTTFYVHADQIELRNVRSHKVLRSILLTPSRLSVDFDNNIVHIDFICPLRNIEISIISVDDRPVYKQYASFETPFIDIDLSGKESGVYVIYFTDSTGECLYGEFTIE